MLTRRAAGLALVALAGLSQVAADCSGGRTEDVLGYVEVGGRPAVYAPLCDDDTVRGVRVYTAPPPGEDGDFVPLWEAEAPIADATRHGLIVLGDDAGFRAVRRAAPARFPRWLSVAVDTERGRIVDEARERPTAPPSYPAGTPAAAMSFETIHGQMSYAELRSTTTCR